MTTTTMAAIVDQWVTVLQALTPTVRPDKPFGRCPPDELLREWVTTGNPGSGCFRRFEFLETGATEDPGLMDPSSVRRTRQATLTIAYPARLKGLFGRRALADVEALIGSDELQVRDALFSAGNYLSGQLATFVKPQPVDRSGAVWLKDYAIDVEYYEAQSLT